MYEWGLVSSGCRQVSVAGCCAQGNELSSILNREKYFLCVSFVFLLRMTLLYSALFLLFDSICYFRRCIKYCYFSSLQVSFQLFTDRTLSRSLPHETHDLCIRLHFA